VIFFQIVFLTTFKRKILLQIHFPLEETANCLGIFFFLDNILPQFNTIFGFGTKKIQFSTVSTIFYKLVAT